MHGAVPDGPGRGPPPLRRRGTSVGYDRARHRFVLESVHPGHTVEEVRDHTGFDFDAPAHVPTTPEPDAATLALIAEVGREIAETYPQFAARQSAAAA